MISIYPSFFPRFRCKADRCRHTCCQTWEIDIDPATEELYRGTPGPLGEELRAWMGTGEGGMTCFKLNEKGYCHFLTDRGLCRLVLDMGEGFLCDICTAHPRFYKYVGDFELCGTGLCCEKTCEDLAAARGPLTFLTEGEEPFTLRDLVRTLGADLKEEIFHWAPDLAPGHVETLLARLAETEPIDDAWTAALADMRENTASLIAAAEAYSYDADLFQRLYHYIWYRQLDAAVPLERLAAYAAEATDFIFLTAARTGNALTAAARWSEQIEYDLDNVDLLIQQ